jgi:hypothetical protein
MCQSDALVAKRLSYLVLSLMSSRRQGVPDCTTKIGESSK